MYGNNYGYYNPTRNIGVPQQPINNQMYQQPIQNYQPIQQVQPIVQNNLQGKLVDSIELAKNSEYPFDGSISYFPLTDGSAIVTKQLTGDGTSKVVIYKPIIEDKKEGTKDKLDYITIEDLDKRLEKLDNSDLLDVLSDDIKNLSKEIRDLKDIRKVKEK